ncbi:hypothetical protein D3C75_941590 [compost metagenome]
MARAINFTLRRDLLPPPTSINQRRFNPRLPKCDWRFADEQRADTGANTPVPAIDLRLLMVDWRSYFLLFAGWYLLVSSAKNGWDTYPWYCAWRHARVTAVDECL